MIHWAFNARYKAGNH